MVTCISCHMGKIKREWNLADTLRIPPEISRGDVRVTILGSYRVWIEHYRGILEYTDQSVVLQVRQGRICIEGKRLRIDYYTKEDMVIRGKILAVRYDDRKGTE